MFDEFLARVYFGNTVTLWGIAIATTLGTFMAVSLLRRLALARFRTVALRTSTAVDDGVVVMLDRLRPFAMAAIALSVGARVVALGAWDGRLQRLVVFLLLIQVGMWIAALVNFLVERMLSVRQTASNRIGIAALQALGAGVRVIVWLVLGILALRVVFHFDVTVLVTGLGVGGIAIALAVQNILGDLFSALAIVLDRPFDVGDSIEVDKGVVGTVEHIGLKTTRLRSPNGEQIIVGNSDLLRSRLRNFRRLVERRALLTIVVTHDTPPDVAGRIPGLIEAAVRAQIGTRFSRAHLTGITEAGLQFEAEFFVNDSDYTRFLDLRQAVQLQLLRDLRAAEVVLATPPRAQGPG